MGLMDLPQDILDFNIGKYLDRSSLISLNEVLGKQSIIYRFSKEFIYSHHRSVLVNKFKSLLRRYETLQYSDSLPRYSLLYRVVQEMNKPVNIVLMENVKFKQTVIEKLMEFQTTNRQNLSLKWYTMFQRQCKKSLKFVLSL